MSLYPIITVIFDHFRYQIAPDERDCLHELLDDLGGEPSLCSLLGATGTATVSRDTVELLVFQPE